MLLRSTLDKQPVDLAELKNQTITIYSCGPTVYDYPHIGNWSAFLRWDLLVRSLRYFGYKTEWVMNITDVGHLVSDADQGQDKLVKSAQKENKTAWQIAEFYTNYFTEALKRLNFSPIDHLPRATDHIDQQIELAKKLEQAGLTYMIDDGLYYDTAKLPDYGKLFNQNVGQLETKSRVQSNPQKRNESDFALWKLSPKDSQRDMEWPSPWGIGFPGWHIECSAIAHHYLGKTLTIHAGGIDHIPIHHTNEIAQSEAAFQAPLSQIWLHSNFFTINRDKMSKSLNNFLTLEDIEDKGYHLASLRLAIFSVNYYKEADFNWALLDNAQARYQRFKSLPALTYQASEEYYEQREKIADKIRQTGLAINQHLQDNLNSSNALDSLDSLINFLADYPRLPNECLTDLRALIGQIDSLFGISLNQVADLTEEQAGILKRRYQARLDNDFQVSDSLRNELLDSGVIVRDTKLGQVWQPE